VTRLRELDPEPAPPPLVHVRLARVVRGQRQRLVVVLVQQVAQVPRAVADVELGDEQVLGPPALAAGPVGDALAGLREQLHQSDRAGAGACIGVELALLVDHRGQQVGLESVVLGMALDDLLVAQRVTHPLVPARLRLEDVEGEPREGDDEHREPGEPAHASAFSSAITPPTQASSSSSEPVFT
jgi:hypothetical protein